MGIIKDLVRLKRAESLLFAKDEIRSQVEAMGAELINKGRAYHLFRTEAEAVTGVDAEDVAELDAGIDDVCDSIKANIAAEPPEIQAIISRVLTHINS